MKKKEPARPGQVKSKSKVARRSGKAILWPFDRLNPSSPVYHYESLRELAPQLRAAVTKLALNRVQGKEIELPAEKLLHDLLNALGQFRNISTRSPHVSLMTLAREADKIWESLRLCKNIGRLATEMAACAIASPMEALEKKYQESGRKDAGFCKRLRALLRQQATAKGSDLEMLILLVPEQFRKQIEIIRIDDPRKNARTDDLQTALAQQCVELLRDQNAQQNAQYLARERSLRPAFDFFLALNDRELFRKAGFISEAEDQEITLLRRSKNAENARERQKRCRIKKARPQA